MRVAQPPLGTPLNRSHPLSQGLAGCWLMNDGGGLKTLDSVGGRNIGNLINGATYTQKQRGLCISCDGSNQYISQTTVSSVLNLTSSCSFSWWFYMNAQPALNTWFRVIDHYGGSIAPGSPYGYFMGYLDISNTKYLSLMYGSANGTTNGYQLAHTLSSNAWYNILMVHSDGTDTDSIYVNGVLAGSATGKTGNPASKPNSPLFFMSEDGTGKFVNGFLQNVYFWNRALSPNEAKQVYASPYCMFN